MQRLLLGTGAGPQPMPERPVQTTADAAIHTFPGTNKEKGTALHASRRFLLALLDGCWCRSDDSSFSNVLSVQRVSLTA